jgi:ferredoxin-type protein NapF
VAQIRPGCLALNGIDCRACVDCCERGAIEFSHQLNAPPKPALNADLCNGCGECAARCPVGAIYLVPTDDDVRRAG